MPVGKFAKTSNTLFRGVHIGGGEHPVNPDPHIHIGPTQMNKPSQPRESPHPTQFYVDMQNPFHQNPYKRPTTSPRLNMTNPFANKNNIPRFDWK